MLFNWLLWQWWSAGCHDNKMEIRGTNFFRWGGFIKPCLSSLKTWPCYTMLVGRSIFIVLAHISGFNGALFLFLALLAWILSTLWVDGPSPLLSFMAYIKESMIMQQLGFFLFPRKYFCRTLLDSHQNNSGANRSDQNKHNELQIIERHSARQYYHSSVDWGHSLRIDPLGEVGTRLPPLPRLVQSSSLSAPRVGPSVADTHCAHVHSLGQSFSWLLPRNQFRNHF